MIINGNSVSSEFTTDALVLGDGVFETLRTYNNRVFALDRHIKRMRLGLEQIVVTWFDEGLVKLSIQKILDEEPLDCGALRIAYYSDGTVIVSHKPYNPSNVGLTCLTSDGQGMASSYKSTSYSSRLSLRRFAVAKGFDDTILINDEGLVSDLLIRFEDRWITPSLESGCLPGVTRGLLIENFGVTEEQVTRKELERVSGAAAISSLREIQVIKSIDGKDFASSRELRELQESFSTWVLGNLLS
jgi:branched-subunit amino acid aminotransferase/4-amino-4-deoxychorismate lyase